MVSRSEKNKSLLAIDALGAAISLGMLALGAWTALKPQDELGTSTRDLSAELAELKSQVGGLRASLAQQERLAEETRRELAAEGPMPSHTPPEEYLQTLSTLAAENRLSVLRQAPLGPREYPGLIEQRFTYEVAGAMSDLARFFRAVETSPCWTDISHLRVEPVKDAVGTAERTALLTFSVFSTAKPQAPPTTQGG